MSRIIPFEPRHFASIALQRGQEEVKGLLTDEHGTNFWRASEEAGTFIDHEHIRACMGLIRWWENNADFWMFVDAGIGRVGLLKLHRELKWRLKNCRYRRVQTVVRHDFDQGKRWAELMGFKAEGLMKKFGTDGMDYWRYAYVREG